MRIGRLKKLTERFFHSMNNQRNYLIISTWEVKNVQKYILKLQICFFRMRIILRQHLERFFFYIFEADAVKVTVHVDAESARRTARAY